jgi:hypothetical protein
MYLMLDYKLVESIIKKYKYFIMDLNIDNYNLEDILNLFKIPYDFGEKHLKQAKMIVLKTHPDKSGLKSEYFLFYSKAYKVLYSIYTFKNKSENKTQPTLINEDSELESQHMILDEFFEKNKKIKEPKQFNKWFNSQFEKHKLEEDNSGYGDWLKTEEGVYHTENVSLSTMHGEFEKHKKQIKSMVVYNGINDLYSSGIGGTLLGEQNGDFTSSMFSNLSYQDIKQAHTETIIPVSEEDFHNVKKFNNLEEYKMHRNTQNITPLTEDQSNKYLHSEIDKQESESNQRAYFYAKQLEESNKKSKLFWGKLQKIKN